jgi:hypothetical protein
LSTDDYVKALKSAFVVISKKIALAYILAELPCLAANPIAVKIIEEILNKLLIKVADSTEMGAFFLYTDIRVKDEGSDFAKAIQEYYSATDEEKVQLEADLISKFEQFVKLC